MVVEAPAREILNDVSFKTRRSYASIIGTVPWYLEVTGLKVDRGRFITDLDIKSSKNICSLGRSVARDLFLYEEPIGREIKIGTQYYRVVGIMKDKTVKAPKEDQPVLDFNRAIFTRDFQSFAHPSLAEPADPARAQAVFLCL